MDMLTSIGQWTIHFCKRSANSVADMMASYTNPAESAQIAELPAHIRLQVNMEKARATSFTRSLFYLPQEDYEQGTGEYHRAGEATSSMH